MDIQIKALRKRDFSKAIQFAITGMHFEWYLDNPFLLQLYGRYFWYLELSRATQVIAAYAGEELAGVLLAELEGEPKKYRSLWKTIYVKLFEFVQNTFYQDSAGTYVSATQQLLSSYLASHRPDGEIVFLAANPAVKGKGIGSLLLSALERRENGKTLFLHTDDACTYPFYEQRGFTRVGEKDICMEMGQKQVPLKCLLYSKTLGSSCASKASPTASPSEL